MAPQFEIHDGTAVVIGLGRTEFYAQVGGVGFARATRSDLRGTVARAPEDDEAVDETGLTLEDIDQSYARSDRAERDRHAWEDGE